MFKPGDLAKVFTTNPQEHLHVMTPDYRRISMKNNVSVLIIDYCNGNGDFIWCLICTSLGECEAVRIFYAYLNKC